MRRPPYRVVYFKGVSNASYMPMEGQDEDLWFCHFGETSENQALKAICINVWHSATGGCSSSGAFSRIFLSKNKLDIQEAQGNTQLYG